MEYNFQGIEKKWQSFWAENKTNQVKEDSQKEKFYVLDMFPYPSGAGLHVGHPLGYIASDIYTRYKRLEGFNVLHPMGYDSFGLPAEQYAIQTGQHPAITTTQNIARYRDQLDKMGFAFDWSREVRTSSPSYYKWTQWIFKLLFESYYDTSVDKAMPIEELKNKFLNEGNKNVQAVAEEMPIFSAQEWSDASSEDREKILLNYRLAYLSDTWVNWCSALGTVLANDEVVNGTSIRGGHPVEQKKMRQWSLRIKAYADRLLQGLHTIDWTESIKEQQRNWIGKSIGASVFFSLDLDDNSKIEVFTTRPDTIFGVSFVVLAPEHPLVQTIVSNEQSADVEAYIKASSLKTERDRQADIKNISGVFTGAYAIHPFSGVKIPVWIGDYVLAGYGTGAVMAVPCGDQRDFNFAKFFNLPIPSIFKDLDCTEEAYEDKDAVIANSSFLNGLQVKDAMQRAIAEIEKNGIGQGKINFRLRDAVFSRQRYWGEPFPVYYKNEIPYLVSEEHLPITLPEVDKYLPTPDGEPPLARSKPEDWNHFEGDRMEYNTMPGWAGSSWYFLRYLDPENQQQFVSKEKVNYWQNVDLYIGGAEHATGHLLYARFWTKFLFDCNLIPFDEPFKKLINQGMILGRSSFVYRIQGTKQYVSFGKKDAYEVIPIHVDISLVDGDKLNVNGFKNWMAEYKDASFILEDDGTYSCGFEVEKMSKSKFNVQTPDELVQKFGADTLRMYEMFLGPLEQSKPWDTKGITGVHGFLKKYWRLFYASGNFKVEEGQATPASLKSLHKTIKRLRDDLDRFSFNTGVSSFMICVNELSEQKCANRHILTQLTLLMAPYAPHITEEIWSQLSPNSTSIFEGQYPKFDAQFLVEENIDYPVSFNGKMRLKITLAQSLTATEIEAMILDLPEIQKWTEGVNPKKIIVVHGKIINIVL